LGYGTKYKERTKWQSWDRHDYNSLSTFLAGITLPSRAIRVVAFSALQHSILQSSLALQGNLFRRS
jgi:hypothetical protein